MTTPAAKPTRNPDLAAGLSALIAALPGYREAAEYYEGRPEEWFSSARVARLLKKARTDRLRLNFAQTPVNAVTERLELTGVSTDNADHQKALTALWDANELDQELPNLFLRAGEFGDAYLYMDVDTEGDETTVELFYNSPLVGRMMYDPENPRRKAYYIKRWGSVHPESKLPVVRVNLVYRDRVERYVTLAKDSKGDKPEDYGPYVGTDEDSTSDTPHIIERDDLGFLPVYHLRAGGRPYGTPEHLHAYGPQDAVNKLAITHLGSIDFVGFPQRWAAEDAASGDDEATPDDIDDIYRAEQTASTAEGTPGVDQLATNERNRPENGLTADPGGMWWLKGVRDVGQFDPADSKNFLDSIVLYIKIMAHVSGTPAYLFDLPGEVPSGTAQRAADAPLEKKAKARRRGYGGAVKDCLEDALGALGHKNAVVSLQWAAGQIVDDTDGWTAAAAKIAAGVPLRQVLLEQGYTDTQLDAWKVPESVYSDDVTLTQQAAMLEQIGKGIQALAAGVALGVISQDQVDVVIESILTRAQMAGDVADDEAATSA